MATAKEINLEWGNRAVEFVRQRILYSENVPDDAADFEAATGFPGEASTAAGVRDTRSETQRQQIAALKRMMDPFGDAASDADADEVAAIRHLQETTNLDLTPPEQKLLDRPCSAIVAAATGFGNCHEMAALAYEFLKANAPVGPIEMVEFDDVDDDAEDDGVQIYDHTWVMIGRDIHSPDFRESNPSTWGADAVWCDPWQRSAAQKGIVFPVADWPQTASPLARQYGIDTPENVHRGRPKSVTRCNTEM